MNELGGFRNEVAVALVGLDVEAKAELVEAAFWEAMPYSPADYASVTTRLVRTDKEDPGSNEEAMASWRCALKDPDERKVGRVVFNATVELGLATIPGFTSAGGSGGQQARPFGVYRPALIPADVVPQHVVVLGRDGTVVESVAPSAAVDIVARPGPDGPSPDGPTTLAPIGRVVGARSGDKGANANLGVFVRSDEAWPWMRDFLTVDELRRLLPEAAGLPIDRHELASIRSLNFVIHGLLEEGVAASTRSDPQAKSLGEWLRARTVAIPSTLLGDS